MTDVAWVCGRGGLLGSHVERALQRDAPGTVFVPSAAAFPWSDGEQIEGALRRAAAEFAQRIIASGASRWFIYWCAGAGVVATPEAALQQECSTFERFLQSLADALRSHGADRIPGCFFLASSAGGVHAGNAERPVTERCAAMPISAYGRAKLAQERSLEAWLAGQSMITAWCGRISNLYGPGQNMAKPQGLISHMSRSVVHNVPIHIYVPLDTLRDYLFVSEAADAIVRWSDRRLRDPRRFVTKLCASEQDTTIATLISTFRRVARRHVKVVSALHPVQNRQPSVLQFRSLEWRDDALQSRMTLLGGVERVYRNQLMLHALGKLPPPRATRV